MREDVKNVVIKEYKSVWSSAYSKRKRYTKDDKCSIKGCDIQPRARGLCSRHYQQKQEKIGVFKPE